MKLASGPFTRTAWSAGAASSGRTVHRVHEREQGKRDGPTRLAQELWRGQLARALRRTAEGQIGRDALLPIVPRLRRPSLVQEIWLDVRVDHAAARDVVDDERRCRQDAELGGQVHARKGSDVGCGIVAGQRLVEVDLVVEQELRDQLSAMRADARPRRWLAVAAHRAPRRDQRADWTHPPT